MKLTSKKLIAHFKTIAHWNRGLGRATACWRAEQVGLEFNEEESKQLNEASRLHHQAEKIIAEIYAARIGKLIAEETRY